MKHTDTPPRVSFIELIKAVERLSATKSDRTGSEACQLSVRWWTHDLQLCWPWSGVTGYFSMALSGIWSLLKVVWIARGGVESQISWCETWHKQKKTWDFTSTSHHWVVTSLVLEPFDSERLATFFKRSPNLSYLYYVQSSWYTNIRFLLSQIQWSLYKIHLYNTNNCYKAYLCKPLNACFCIFVKWYSLSGKYYLKKYPQLV